MGNPTYSQDDLNKGNSEEKKTEYISEGILEAQVIVQPTIGRIVIFVPNEEVWPGELRNYAKELPAIVTATWPNNLVNIKVINDGIKDVWYTSVNHSDEKLPGTWHWPVIK